MASRWTIASSLWEVNALWMEFISKDGINIWKYRLSNWTAAAGMVITRSCSVWNQTGILRRQKPRKRRLEASQRTRSKFSRLMIRFSWRYAISSQSSGSISSNEPRSDGATGRKSLKKIVTSACSSKRRKPLEKPTSKMTQSSTNSLTAHSLTQIQIQTQNWWQKRR